MTTFSTLEVAVLSVGTVCFLLLAIVLGLCCYQWYKAADCFWMKARWSKWQICAVSIASILFVGVSAPLQTWRQVWIKDPSNIDIADNSVRNAAHLFSVVFRIFCILICTVLVFSRLWLTYFDASLCLELAALQWKQLIDPRLHTDRINWFVANQKTWGSRSHVLKVVTALTLLLMAAFAVVTVFYDAIVNFLYATFLLFIAISMAIFAKKYPAFRDSIHLREEANFIKWLVSVFVVAFVIGSVAFFLVKPKDDSVAFVLIVVIRQLLTAMFAVAYLLTTVSYVASFFARPSLVAFGIPLLFHLDSTSDDSVEGSRVKMIGSRALSHPRAADKRISLRTVLRDDIGCRLLMSHLLSELSHENLLALIECVKFRERMAVVCGVQLEASDQLRAENLFGFEVFATESALVAALESLDDAPHVFAALCLKYLDTTSPTVVNMSYLTRKDAQSLMDNSSKLDPFCLDPIIRVCIDLLRDSFSRFSRTENFVKFAEERKSV